MMGISVGIVNIMGNRKQVNFYPDFDTLRPYSQRFNLDLILQRIFVIWFLLKKKFDVNGNNIQTVLLFLFWRSRWTCYYSKVNRLFCCVSFNISNNNCDVCFSRCCRNSAKHTCI